MNYYFHFSCPLGPLPLVLSAIIKVSLPFVEGKLPDLWNTEPVALRVAGPSSRVEQLSVFIFMQKQVSTLCLGDQCSIVETILCYRKLQP